MRDIYAENVKYLGEEFSKDPCGRTLHNLVSVAKMNKLLAFALFCVDEHVPEAWFEKLNEALFGDYKV